MDTYKLGNKIKCIIRAASPCKIGDEVLEYKNQPYTVIKDIEANLSFRSVDKTSSAAGNLLNYQIDYVDEIELIDVSLNDKILNLIGSENDEKLCNTSQNCWSDDENKIYLSGVPSNKIYQVFIINAAGKLERAYGELDISEGIEVDEINAAYLVCYSYDGETSIRLEKEENLYVTLDLEIIGDINNATSAMWIHLERCSVHADKTLYFRGNANTINLSFKVIKDKHNYITFK